MRTSMPLFAWLVGALGTAACTGQLIEPDGEGGGGSVLHGDLPCDVAELLSTHCVSCHAGGDPSGGVALTSHAALTAPSPADGSVTVAERALLRMRDAALPMPQAGLLPESEVAVLAAWIDAGMPKGDCSGGAGGSPPITIACSSTQFWTQGDEGSKDMHPGHACVSCHEQPNDEGEKGPPLGFAGTVYPTPHEPDDCVATGVGGAVVVVTDANGATHQVSVRASGNFYAEEVTLAFPIRAEIRKDGKVLAMQDPVMTGDCNACHTAEGTDGASGRIFPPN